MSISIENQIAAAIRQGIVEVRGQLNRGINQLRRSLKGVELLEAAWLNYRSGGSSYPPDLGTESTYDGCTDWSLDLNTRILTVVMWDGDLLDGFRTERRCHWMLNLVDRPDLVTSVVGDRLQRHLLDKALDARADYLAEVERLAVNAIYESYFT